MQTAIQYKDQIANICIQRLQYRDRSLERKLKTCLIDRWSAHGKSIKGMLSGKLKNGVPGRVDS